MPPRAGRVRHDVKTSFYLPRTTLRTLKQRAAEQGVSLRVVLLHAVNAYLARRPTRED
jgi:hypothetical protein